MKLRAIALPAADRSWMEDFSPITIAVWNYDRAAHLLERAGFGGTPQEIERLAAGGPVKKAALACRVV